MGPRRGSLAVCCTDSAGMQGRDTEESRATVPTLVYGHLELTIGDLLLVSHAPPIGSIHELWDLQITCVGQATVSKFIEVEKGKFRLEFTGDASHLSNKRNLRPF
ncbi:hypothetical protein Y032_0019g3892 [Ancylostoma ceylanicum]|uniref:Uncharacterized protein n=1 Tax=Ancylostoma ceylanicum TaxID=53326 RepID=A0A016V2U8_9BILA|nr:hypothetical protein Y032_0019g3892 [Ancylostoma ceylanicum]